MRRLLKWAGPCLAALLAVSMVGATGTDKLPGLATDKPSCASHGTTIDFMDTPSEAAKVAEKQGKLVFVLHISGHLEDPRFL
jgi:hypothetical protein